jgi:hypothetical protein
MNPQDLIAPSSPLGNPAPFWFITFFKVLGFTLHMIPMNIWYAGMLLVAVFATFGKGHSEELAHRLSRSMPIIVALGVNLGVVPLLFTQVGYYQFYYPTGVLIGWAWLSVILFLLFAYYSVYVYSLSVRKDKRTTFAVVSAWVSSILFITIGFLFANNFSLMVNAGQWIKIFDRTNVAGAVTGRALNISDPTLVPRWLMMFGIAMMTTSVFIAIDALYFKKSSTTREYKAWAGRFAFRFFTYGMIWYALMGAWYISGTMDSYVLDQLHTSPVMLLIFVFTAISPGAVWIAMSLQRKGVKERLTNAALICQLGVLTLNAISRQWLQNTELSRFKDVSKELVNTQWSPMILFVALFVVGLGVIAWMVARIMEVEKATANSGNLKS